MGFKCLRMKASFLLLPVIVLFAAGSTLQKTETFDSDPGWEGFRNRIKITDPPVIVQDFGFSVTNFAGKQAGEIGGRISRSTRPAYYADQIEPRSLEEQLTASGSFALTASSTGSGIFFGWFNSRQQGFRPVNFLGFRLDGEEAGGTIHVDYTTQTWKAGGHNTHLLVKPDGLPHTWKISYDPAASKGQGAIVFQLDNHEPQVLTLAPGHKSEGAVFDRFGMFNIQVSGGPMTIYFDDLEYNDRAEDFSTDPGWEGEGNRGMFRITERRNAHDFGFSKTNFAGGSAGEIGGTFWRIEPELPYHAYYADRVGSLTLQERLFASGRVSMTRASSDSGMFLGWFNSKSLHDGPPTQFLAVMIEGPSRVGHYFRPAYRIGRDVGRTCETGPIIMPNSARHRWTLEYDPAANQGNGTITVTLDDERVRLDLEPGHKSQCAQFDRFGMFSVQPGGHFLTVYFDDLEYTAGQGAR